MTYRYYDFKCASCGKKEDRLISEDQVKTQTCTICFAPLQKLITSSGHYTIAGNNQASTPPQRKVKK